MARMGCIHPPEYAVNAKEGRGRTPHSLLIDHRIRREDCSSSSSVRLAFARSFFSASPEVWMPSNRRFAAQSCQAPLAPNFHMSLTPSPRRAARPLSPPRSRPSVPKSKMKRSCGAARVVVGPRPTAKAVRIRRAEISLQNWRPRRYIGLGGCRRSAATLD